MATEELNSKFDEKFDLEIQKKFISLLIFDKNWAVLSGLDLIKPECFENNVLHNICLWIHEYYQKYKSLPTKTILVEQAKEYVGAGGTGVKTFLLYKDAIEDIFTRDDNDDTEYYKDKVIIFIRQAAWKQALAKGTETLRYGNYEDALNAFKKVLSYGAETDLGLDFSELPTEKFLDLLSEAYDPAGMLKTGLEGWDKALGGGFVRKNVHIIAAPPGAGKSRTMAFLTKNALKARKKVIFITLELSEAETMANICTSATGMSLHEMLNPQCINEFKEKVAQFKKAHGSDLIIKFYKPGAVTTDTLHNFIQRVIQKKTEELGYDWKPDAIFIDYLDKLLPTQKVRGNSYEDIGGVANDCKNLGITFDCPVITGSQLGRYSWVVNGADVVTMDSIAESAQKVHLAHSMTTINMNKNEKDLMRARLYMAKSRSGIPNRIIWCEYNLGKCSLREIPEWDPTTLTSTATYTIKDTSKR